MAEEIVKVITIDTRKSERSIKDLKDDIKALKKELENTTIGSKDFDLKLTQLGQLQKEYKAINEEIVSSSKPVQKQMFELARFGENLAKSYSAINAAIGLLSDGNEDVQKALLKTSQMIQLIQGLSGFAPMLRDIPKLVDNFKNWFKWLDPINSRINNIASKIIGFDVNKLNQLGNVGTGGNSATATTGSIEIEAQNEALAKQTHTYYPALLDQRRQLLKTYNDQMKAYEVELDYYKQMKTFMLDVGEGILNTARDVNGQLKTQEQFIKDYMDYMENVKGYAKEDIIPSLAAITKEFGTQSVKMDEMAESIKKTEEKMAGLQKEIDLAEVGMSKFAKTLYRIPILGKAVQLAITGIKVALASIGIGLLIQGLSWLISQIPKLKNQTVELNKEIAKSANTISSKGIVALKELAERYRAVGDTADAKKKFLVDFKKEIQETGLAIRNVSEADEAFINNTDAYINALKQRAKAQAIQSKAVEIYQEYLDEVTKKENTRKGRQAAEDKKLAEDLVGAGVMTQEEADAVGTTTKLGKKLKKMEDEVEATLDRLFEEMFELEEKSDQYFAEVEEGAGETTQTVVDTKKEELEQLKQYYNDALKLFMDARTRELQEVEEKYAEQIALAKKHNQDTTLLEQAKQREIDNIIKKYEDERLQRQKEQVEEELARLQQQIDRIRMMNDTSNLSEPQEQSYTTEYKQGFGHLFAAGSRFFYQSGEDVQNQYDAQIEYNNKILELTKSRIEQENALLNQQLEVEGITAERKLEIERTLRENEMALSDAAIKNEADNINAYKSLQEKKNLALQNSLSVASDIFGSMAQIAGEETKAGKAFAVTQAVIDTYAAANSAYASMAGIPYVGPALGIAAAAAAIASGIANVKTILSTKVSATETSVSLPSGSAVTPPALSTPPIEYTRNLLGNKETDELNKPTKVYVLESDITDAQNRVKVTEDNASF